MKSSRLLVYLVLSEMLIGGCSSSATAPTPLPATSAPVPASTNPPPMATIASPKVAATAASPQMAPTPEFVMQIVNKTDPFSAPNSVALDTQGNIYVIDASNSRVQKFDRDGKFLTMWGSQGKDDGQFMFGGSDVPQGDVAVDAAGNVYIADYGNYRVQKFDRDGKFLAKWGSQGGGDGQFKSPASIAADPQDNVYVTDFENDVVQKFDATGKFLLRWGGTGTGDGQFKGPTGIAIDQQGNVHVADNRNARLQTFDSNGKFISKFPSPMIDYLMLNVGDISVDQAGNLYIPDGPFDRVIKLDPNGKVLTVGGSVGSDEGQFQFPFSVAVDAAGNIYVADGFNARLQKFRQP